MPLVYRAKCMGCGKSPEVGLMVAGWAASRDCEGGSLLTEGYLAVKLDNGEFECLPHPIEGSRLQKLGFTWEEAERQKRLFYIVYLICQRCGWIHEKHYPTERGKGCCTAVFALFIILFILKFAFKLSWILAFIGANLSLYVVFKSIVFYKRAVWRLRNRHIEPCTCPKCQATDLVTVSKAAGKSLMCPFCHTKSMRYECTGRS